ncbi:MAG: AAA family ATPase, partial [Planctomycetes bacterium]|nr:AAA family ATPase [Planctomycetota bacterium]
CIGATTLDEYREHVEKDKALERRFQPVYIDEPDVEDTIAILRGLKGKYEAHHGLRIEDAALVAAAKLSHRYITGRFLPDKAIDLMDEAASRIRLEIESVPSEIDDLERQLTRLQVELQAMKMEKSKEAKERVKTLGTEVAELEAKAGELRKKWQEQRDLYNDMKQIKQESERVKIEMENAERHSDLQRAAELKYGVLPGLEKELHDKEQVLSERQKGGLFLREEVTDEDIAMVVAKWTGIPVSRMLESESSRLLHIEERLESRVVGQDKAVTKIAKAIRLARAGLQSPNRPIGSFLFLGPTGVGKTELAKALAEFLFDDEQNLVRIDMSEYMEKHTVSRLLGAPPGYIGYEEGGQLTELIRRRPYSVVLLDEIEKAHADVFNVLLQVMDDGRLTDGHGRTVDFRNTILIMTSNIGSQQIQDLTREDEIDTAVRQTLRGVFRPEFLNRVDAIIVFNQLNQSMIRKIVNIQLQQLQPLLAQRELKLVLTDKAKDYLAERGYEPAFGARPLKRIIREELLEPLSEKLIAGEIFSGDEVKVDLHQGKLQLKR